jgi:5'-nucleotidase
MNKKRLALDMDGVLADVYEQYFKMDEEDFGKRRPLADIEGVQESLSFPNIREYLYRPGFFRNAPVMEGSRDIVKKLDQEFELFIVSAAMEFPLSLAEKKEWLNEHFPFIKWQQIVFCGSKRIISADIMIDDHFKNLDTFPGQTILFSQPHNIKLETGRHTRVNSWTEIGNLLLVPESNESGS